jgi:hypothetical protein
LAILESEIQFRLSGGSVGAGNTDPVNSLGGTETSTQIASDTAQNLFDNVTGSESLAGDIEYRCFFVRNTNATLTLENAKIWIAQNTSSGDDTIAIALGNVAVGTSNEQTIAAGGKTAPSSPTLSFSTSATSSGTALSIGNIPPGQHKGVWLRRTVNAGAGAYTNNQFQFTVEGESQ